ncbi:MAG: hypothetical protein HN348_09505 [Proteobacteria bacterium]|jgi:hypothetical protein|nr:hypothetical protein [Pseudomonadota bacterium]
MVERVLCEVDAGELGIRSSLVRYSLLERLARCVEKNNVTILAFGIGDYDLRLVLQGGDDEIVNAIRGMKVGTARAAKTWGVRLVWAPTQRWGVAEGAPLEQAIAWAHRAPVDSGAGGPLSSPWSSHRDLLMFRRAKFYDAAVLDQRVNPGRVHLMAGGIPLPEGWPPSPENRESMSVLLRIAASVLGVLPADRRCFQLFVHLALKRGWRVVDLAGALCLTNRRIRQLRGAEEPLLTTALVVLSDPRLCCVP